MAYPYYQSYPYSPLYFQQQQNIQAPTQIQNGGLVMVKDINEAMSYPVAPGNSVTFKNENLPYLYTKTLGFSQLDQPVFEIFKLVKEEVTQNTCETPAEAPVIEFFSVEDGNRLMNEIQALKGEIQFLKELITDDNKEVISA